jgi:hypothetical protein
MPDRATQTSSSGLALNDRSRRLLLSKAAAAPYYGHCAFNDAGTAELEPLRAPSANSDEVVEWLLAIGSPNEDS